MLGAAHVLAMDSKNLLDVIDTIRIRYPHINKQFQKFHDATSEIVPVTETEDFHPTLAQAYSETSTASSSTKNQAVDS